jgi:hypothetical protein
MAWDIATASRRERSNDLELVRPWSRWDETYGPAPDRDDSRIEGMIGYPQTWLTR